MKSYNCPDCVVPEVGDNFNECNNCIRFRESSYIVKCSKCGWSDTIVANDYITQNTWHGISFTTGYGSKLDGCDVKFNLCDDCLYEIINGFTEEAREKIFGGWETN